MQKLIVRNLENNETIEFGLNKPYLLTHIEGVGLPSSSVSKTQGVLMDGYSNDGALLEARVIRLRTTIIAENRKELYKLRRKLMRTLNPRIMSDDYLEIYYVNDNGTYRIYGHVEEEVKIEERYNNILMGDISFECSDPYYLDEYDTKMLLKYISGGMQFGLSLPTTFAEIGYEKTIENKGDVMTPLIIEYIGGALNPIVTNVTTGEFIKINRELEENEKLYINTEDGKQTVEIIDAEGNRINVFNWIDLESTFFKLVPGVNKIRYGSDSDTSSISVNLKFSNKYVGA